VLVLSVSATVMYFVLGNGKGVSLFIKLHGMYHGHKHLK